MDSFNGLVSAKMRLTRNQIDFALAVSHNCHLYDLPDLKKALVILRTYKKHSFNEYRVSNEIGLLESAIRLHKPVKPYHEHDCENCVYLGSDHDKKRDFYFHKGPMETTVISRYGELGAYSSGLVFGVNAIKRGDNSHPLATALRLAINKNLITFEEAIENGY